MSLEITPIPQLTDNYAYLVRETETDEALVVDPAEPSPIIDALNKQQLKLTHILNTHHHPDHTGGNKALERHTRAKIVGSDKDAARIPGISLRLKPGEAFVFKEHRFKAVLAEGHTTGHLLYWCEAQKILFTGDTLFSMGCGRLFEGSAESMWKTLQFFKSIDPETKVYFGHEYTLENSRFALTIEPHNEDLRERHRLVKEMREKGLPTTPVEIRQEWKTNPFLRTDQPAIAETLGIEGSSEPEVFKLLRQLKDKF